MQGSGIWIISSGTVGMPTGFAALSFQPLMVMKQPLIKLCSTSVSESMWSLTRTLQRMDRKCDQEKGLAFPRLTLDGYAPFFGVMRKFFDECWTKLGPEGLPDVTPRLAQVFAHAFSLQDPMETLSRFYKVTLAATGSITRLHVEVAGAHTWLNQIEGRRAFFLFPPSESRKLYEETGGPMQETSGFATSISGVDILAPSAKRHPLFAEAKSLALASVLDRGKQAPLPGSCLGVLQLSEDDPRVLDCTASKDQGFARVYG
ncbi:unnamed protein product [Cladocopium goreaui]|uniref:JmjC domain-containing protein n=1 Tax=Cladocopium goreaui TaxID=2562237 RepID=A0A9P1GPC8_9DINO|nr:unnamed protein product [Cladocopium goreaui]